MAVKNVTFEVSADTTKAQASLNALVQQLEQIKKNSTISLSQSTGNIDAQIKDLTSKLDKLAADNQKRLNTETKNAVDSQKTKTTAVKNAIDEQIAAYRKFAEYNADILKKEIKAYNDAAKAKAASARDTQKSQTTADRDAAKTTKESTAYFQVSESVRTLTARSKELGAELILLEQNGQKNSAAYKKLASEYATVRAEAEKAASALKSLNTSANVTQAKQNFGGLTGAINFLTQSVANSSTNFTRLRNIIARTGVALGAVSIGAAILSVGRAAIKAASDYEVLNVSFGTLIGNTELAKVKIQELRQFAAETPFTTEDVFQASRTLLGYGLAAGELIPTIKRLGDVAGGVGVPLQRVALVFGQVRAAGRLYGQDLLQLVTLGFNPLAEISRTTGKSFAQLKDEMRKGLVTFEDVNKAFISATSEGGKFFNLTNALANTTQGRLARLKEEWTILLTTIGQGLQPAYESIIAFGRALIAFVNDLPKFAKESSLAFTALVTVTTALTSALLANTLNFVANSAKTVINTAVKIGNGLASAKQAVQTTLATRAITAQTIGQAALAGATSLATSAVNAFKLAWATNPLGLIITLLSTAAAAWYAFSDAVDTSQDGFLDAKEAINEITVRSQKESESEIAALKQNLKVANDTNKSLKERQAALDKVNKQYETSYKLTNDEKKNTIDTTAAQNDLTEAIKKTNKERIGGEVLQQAQGQITKITTEILNTASGLEIPLTPELLLDDEQIKGEFKNAETVIQQQIDNLKQNRQSFTSTLIPGITGTVNTARRDFVNAEINQLDALIQRLNTLRQAYGVYSAIQGEIITPGTDTGLGDPEDAKEKEKERLRRIADFNKELSDLLNRIRKNNEEIRKNDIEFAFVDANYFELELEKLKFLDEIQEDAINREIDREIDAVRRRELTEQQKSLLISQLEIIRGQEQTKRAQDLNERLYKVERDGIRERTKIFNDWARLQADNADLVLERQLQSFQDLRDELDSIYSDIFEDNPFSKGRFITAPLTANFGFQFEDIAQAPTEAIEQLRKSISELNIASEDLPLLSDTEAEIRNQLIDEFNNKYGTTIAYVTNELDLQTELSKEYEKRVQQAKDLFNAQNQQGKKQNIFQFSRAVQERGAIDPFTTAIEDNQRLYFEALNERQEGRKLEIKQERDRLAAEYIVQEDGAYKVSQLDRETAAELKAIDNETSDLKDARSKEDIDLAEKRKQAQLKIIEEERDARLQALEDITKAVLDFQKVFIDGQIQQTEAAISAQEKRVQAAQEIADRGNVVLLKAEQERLDKLNRQRASFVRQQQNLAAVEIAVNAAVAVSKAAGQPGSPFTIFAILAAMAVGFAQARAQAQSAATFAKGGYTGDGHQFQEAGTVHKGEFVMNAQKTRQYRPLLEAIHAGRNPKALQSVQDRMLIVNSQSTDERLERIERAIIGQKGMQLSIDENGINGIVSRITYKQQRINNRAR
jgi:hypothetical protein